jgi:hypothetical protein
MAVYKDRVPQCFPSAAPFPPLSMANSEPMRMLPITLLAGFLLFAAEAAAQVPMPLPRPGPDKNMPAPVARISPPAQPARPAVPQASRPARSESMPTDEDEGAPCTELLASGIAEVELNAAISGSSGPALCGDIAPVRMTAILLEGGGKVELRPAAVARCEMALEFARWVREDVTWSVRPLGSGLKRIEIAASYHCRPRNNVSGARLSEHGLANAIDVGALVLDDGRRIAIVDPKAPQYLFAEMRMSACARFTTVLAPGADASHTDHVHLDLAKRRGGYRMCQWPYADWPIP